MNNHQPMDPFTYHVMEQIDPKGACLTYPILFRPRQVLAYQKN